VAFTGAGAAGVLPDPVQETFSSVVGTGAADETAVPDHTTGTGADQGTGAGTDDVTEVEDPALETPVDVAPTDLTLEDWAKGPAPDQSFGDWVRNGARHGYADGKTISEWAHARNEDRRGGAAASTTPATETEAPEVENEERWTGSTPEVESGWRGDSSNGGGNGSGHGGGNGGGHGRG
jgi:hypothetical protein